MTILFRYNKITYARDLLCMFFACFKVKVDQLVALKLLTILRLVNDENLKGTVGILSWKF